MNEIEKAIKHFEGLQKRYTTQHNGKHCELVKTALTALREKAEREKGCEYCKVLTPDAATGFALPSIYPDCEFDLVTIAHCPMCGRKLGEEND